VPAYLRTDSDRDEPVWFSEYGLEQTRPVRALKVWMQLRHLGRPGYRPLSSVDIAVADACRTEFDAASDFEVLGWGLSVVCFRHLPTGTVQLDDHNRRLLRALQSSSEAFLAGTTVDDQSCFRACDINPGTRTRHLLATVQDIRGLALLTEPSS
jgi:aromatic-L-amino-acid decarboxylase